MTLSHSLTSEIIDLSHDGRGVAKNHYSDSGIPEFSGKTAFIKNALVGETVRWRVTRESRQYIEGLTTHIERAKPSTHSSVLSAL